MDANLTQLTRDLRGTFRGRVALDDLTRGLYSTDASPFQIQPLGVAFPLDAADLSVLVTYCFEHTVPMIPRGAGTGIAGESLGPALVIDLSTHFRRILDITSDTVTVEPGVVYAELNAELARRGRRFAPDPASGASCTLGGMVATNASGGNSLRYGYTRDHVVSLDLVHDDGTFSRDAERSAPAVELIRANRELIDRHRPKTAFNRCGYMLHDVLTDAGLDLAKLLVGSEGTLGFVTAATLRTVPLAGGTCVALLGFPTFDRAIRAGLELRDFGAVGCDLLDRRLMSLTRSEPNGVPASVGAALFITVEADTERDALARTKRAVQKLRDNYRLVVLAEPASDPEGMARIKSARTSAVAGLYALGRGARPLAFVEDVGVPTDVLSDYVTRVQDILQTFELTGSFLIHVLTGQVHTRPLIDLDSAADREKLWPAAEAIHALALSLGGTVSTQHGTGIARTPWVEKQYGELMPVFRELKRIFDPKGLLNPGKIIGPDPSRPAWPLRSGVRRQESGDSQPEPENRVAATRSGAREPLLVWSEHQPDAEAARCNGCGDCRPRGTTTRMCPTFRANGEEAATPRAKANLFRLLTDPSALSTDAAKAVADLCVNCKMCRDECPAKVNVPKLALEVKAAHHAEHGLDRADWVLARTESFAALGSNFAPFVNAVLGRRSLRWLLEKTFGVSQRRRLPAFAMRNFLRRARGLGLSRKSQVRKSQVGNAAADLGLGTCGLETRKVAYFVDVFANYNDPLIGEATVAVLRHNGIEVHVPPRQVGCGMSPLAQGDIETAREMAERNLRVFADLVRDGYTVVCSEPTAALMLTQDYLDILDDPAKPAESDARLVAENTVELTTFLWELHRAGKLRTDFARIDVTLGHHVPCHLKALRGPAAGPGLLALIPGVRAHTIDVSCSGMAGTWGLKAANYAASLDAGRPMLVELDRPGVLFGSTECSACRMQMQEGTGKRTLHPVQYLAHAYGLLPEIGARLRKPLTDLVSD